MRLIRSVFFNWIDIIFLGKEKPDFWAALGDRRHHLVPAPLEDMQRPLPPRLFYVSISSPGHYTCTFVQFKLHLVYLNTVLQYTHRYINSLKYTNSKIMNIKLFKTQKYPKK